MARARAGAGDGDAGEINAKKCFVIAPIGPERSAARLRSDQVFEFLIRPVVEPRGYSVSRADHVPTPGVITNQIIDLVIDSDLVIADLSDANANVFYELAIRHVTQRPFIQLVVEGQDIPFDVTVMRTIFYDMTDPFKIEVKKKELEKQVDAVASGDPLETPISNAVEIKQRRTSGDKTESALASLQEEIGDLRSEVRMLRTRALSLPAADAIGLPGATGATGPAGATTEELRKKWQLMLESARKARGDVEPEG